MIFEVTATAAFFAFGAYLTYRQSVKRLNKLVQNPGCLRVNDKIPPQFPL